MSEHMVLDSDEDPEKYDIIKRCVDKFIADIGEKTGLRFITQKERNQLRHARLFLEVEMDNERSGDIAKSFIEYCARDKIMCSVMVSSGIYEFEPKRGVILSGADVGHTLVCRAEREQNGVYDMKEEVTYFKEAFSDRIYHGKHDIVTIVVPINIRGVHWAVLIGKLSRKQGVRLVDIWFGDSLGWQCPKNILTYFSNMLSTLFDAQIQSRHDNYMLNVLGFQKQMDSYSCGAYVLATVSKFAVSRGCMPAETFETYKESLAEDYRWAAARCRLCAIISGTYCRRHMAANVHDVNLHEVRWRDQRFAERRHLVKRKHEDTNSERRKQMAGTKRRRRTENNVNNASGDVHRDGRGGKEKNVSEYKGMRSVQEPGPYVVAEQGVIGNLMKNASNDGHGEAREGKDKALNESGGMENVQADNMLRGVQSGVFETGKVIVLSSNTVQSLGNGTPREQLIEGQGERFTLCSEKPVTMGTFSELLTKLFSTGHGFGVHKATPFKFPKKYAATIRLRCLRHQPPINCSAAVTMKMLHREVVGRSDWEVWGKLGHNHDLAASSSDVCKRRENIILQRIKECLKGELFRGAIMPLPAPLQTVEPRSLSSSEWVQKECCKILPRETLPSGAQPVEKKATMPPLMPGDVGNNREEKNKHLSEAAMAEKDSSGCDVNRTETAKLGHSTDMEQRQAKAVFSDIHKVASNYGEKAVDGVKNALETMLRDLRVGILPGGAQVPTTGDSVK